LILKIYCNIIDNKGVFMAKTVFIFGAGASAESGVPLMSDFLDKAQSLMREPLYSDSLKCFSDVFSTISNMQVIQSKAQFDLQNIESVFACVEFANLLNINFQNSLDINAIRESVITLIYRTIELTSNFIPYENKHRVSGAYDRFASILKQYAFGKDKASVALLTFNYDICLDYAIHSNGYYPDYGFKNISYFKSNSVPLLKLHGSINWGICKKCGIKPIFIDKLSKKTFSQPEFMVQISPSIDIISSKCDICNTDYDKSPFIVPPTWNKTQYHTSISEIWSEAARHLNEAENIIIIGYSLPPTDYFFHYLYALGTMGKTCLKNFWVCDIDENIEQKYIQLLGQQARQRFKFIKRNFSESISEFERLLN
jgi:NAD-dependent SIR2 family protein deacetylase